MSLNDFEVIKRLGTYTHICNLFLIFFAIGEGAYSSVYHVRRFEDN